jgi:hypothetical protein
MKDYIERGNMDWIGLAQDVVQLYITSCVGESPIGSQKGVFWQVDTQATRRVWSDWVTEEILGQEVVARLGSVRKLSEKRR